MNAFDRNESLILNHIQGYFPIKSRPYAKIGSDLKMDEKDVIKTIDRLKKRNIIRNIAGIFNPQCFGYYLRLVGMEIAQSSIEHAASIINSHPGVSHNYIRNHRYNIWFTLAEESENLLNRTVQIISETIKAYDFVVLEGKSIFKLNVNLQIGKTNEDNKDITTPESYEVSKLNCIGDEEKEAVRLLQIDLPLEKRPFFALVKNNNSFLSEKRLLEIGNFLNKVNVLRRFSAVLQHMKAGYKYNAMTTWKVPNDECVPKIIKTFVNESSVSHLYLRTIIPQKWEYPLFAMIHAKSESMLNDIVDSLSIKSGITDFLILKSMKELKKKRVVYFSEDFSKWRNAYS